MSDSKDAPDRVVRAMTDDGGFRVVAAQTTSSVRGAIRAQKTGGPTAIAFAELLTGATIVRELMAPFQRVQLIVSGAQGLGTLVADSLPDGMTRGLVSLPPGLEHIDLGAGSRLRMVRGVGAGQAHEAIVEIPKSRSIAAALMTYLAASQRTPIQLVIGAVRANDGILACGGFAVQTLPDATQGDTLIMDARVEDLSQNLIEKSSANPDGMIDEIFYGMKFTRLEERPIAFGCVCDEARVMSALATLGKSEIESAIRDGSMLEMSCDYCGKEYRISPERLKGLLDPS